MNPHDWFMFSAILAKEKPKYMNQITHLDKMIRFYFVEINKMDVELAIFLKKKPTPGPCGQPDDI